MKSQKVVYMKAGHDNFGTVRTARDPPLTLNLQVDLVVQLAPHNLLLLCFVQNVNVHMALLEC